MERIVTMEGNPESPVRERESRIDTGESLSNGDRKEQSPRVAEIPQDTRFEGFSPEQEVWTRRQLEIIGLPLINLKKVSYEPNEPGKENVLGSFQYDNGHMKLYKSLEKLPEIAQLETQVHELAHQNDPTTGTGLESGYKTEAFKEHAEKHARQIAAQTLNTNKYLTGYHKILAKRLEEGVIDMERFVRETHSIMAEQRYSNPNHIKQVEEAQFKALDKKGAKDKFIKIMTSEGEEEPQGIDKTLIGLIEGVDNNEQLNEHLQRVRDSFGKEENLHPNQSFKIT